MKETAGDPLAQGRLVVVAATIGINIVGVTLLTFAPWSDWKTGLALNLVDNALLLGYVTAYRDLVLARFMVFGVAVGFAELGADAWLVDFTTTLDYSIGGGPMLWRSPLWMPFAWEVVAVQFGYVGLWLWERFGKWGLAAIGLLGAINIPYYEEMARRINWWQYGNCRMLSYTPYYISSANSELPSYSLSLPSASSTEAGRHPSSPASPAAWASSPATPSPTASPTASSLPGRLLPATKCRMS